MPIWSRSWQRLWPITRPARILATRVQSHWRRYNVHQTTAVQQCDNYSCLLVVSAGSQIHPNPAAEARGHGLTLESLATSGPNTR